MNLFLVTIYTVFIFLCGYAYASIHTEIDKAVDCGSFNTKHALWEGYWAINQHNERRCFWLETRFPYRVMQGVNVK